MRLRSDAERSLAHNTQVDFYSGSQEIPARVRLLDCEEVQPGQSAWVQLRLSRPAVVARRDHFILRIPSPSMTVGGGEILDVQPRYHRRFQTHILASLEQLAQGSPEELVLAALDRRRVARTTTESRAVQSFVGYELADIVKLCNLSEDVTRQILDTFLSAGRVRRIGGLWFARHTWDALTEEAVRLVREQHRQYPLRGGLSKEEWRVHLGLAPKIAAEVFAILQAEGRLETVKAMTHAGAPYLQEAAQRAGGLIRLPDFTPHFTSLQQQQVEQLLHLFREHPYTPPGRTEAEALADPEVVASLIEQGRLVKLGDGVLFLRETYDEALTRLVAYLREHGKITVAQARDILGATRKSILPLLEQMDALRITRRVGDERFLRTNVFT
jgi:selenocysteine-specific elongation factor